MGIGEKKIRSIMRERVGARARGIVAYICKALCDKTAKEVGRYFCRSEPILSQLIRRVEFELAEKKSDTKELVQQITATIKKNYRPCLVREVK